MAEQSVHRISVLTDDQPKVNERKSSTFEGPDMALIPVNTCIGNTFLQTQAEAEQSIENIISECLENMNCITGMNPKFLYQVDRGLQNQLHIQMRHASFSELPDSCQEDLL